MTIIIYLSKIKYLPAPNQALSEGVPSGQADGCQLGTLSIAGGGFPFLLFSL
jgi:hypothetical protein